MKMIKNMAILLLVFSLLGTFWMSSLADAEETIKLVGVTMQPPEHIYFRTLEKFSELLEEKYPDSLEIDLHHSGDIGNESDFTQFMVEGISIDFCILAPAWMSVYDKAVGLMDTPFLWENHEQWRKGLTEGVFESLEKNLIKKGIRIIGYPGGGSRHLCLNKKVETIDELPKVRMRVMGSPIQANVFNAIGINAVPIDYLETYNAIKTGVVDGLENEASSYTANHFYEVAPYIMTTAHTITIRPICFSEKRFEEYPEKLQQAILEASQEASEWARETEIAEDIETWERLEKEEKVTIVEFKDTDKMREKALPVIEDYAKELGASAILEEIKNL